MSKYHTFTQATPAIYLPMKAGFNGEQIEVAVITASVFDGAAIRFDRVYPILDPNDAIINYNADNYAPIVVSWEQAQPIAIADAVSGLGQFGLSGDGWLRVYAKNPTAITNIVMYISLN